MGSFIQTLEEAIISFPNTTYYQIMGFRATISSLLLLTILIICTSNHVAGKYLLMETVDKPASENGLEIGTANDYVVKACFACDALHEEFKNDKRKPIWGG